jgi:hypothetical protein
MSSCTYTVYGELVCSSNQIELDNSNKPIGLDYNSNKQNTELIIQPFDSSALSYGALNESNVTNESDMYKQRCMNSTILQ